MLCDRVERVADPIHKGLALDLGGFLPGGAFGVRATNRKHELGRLSLDAGWPSGSLPSSSAWHGFYHYREYTEESLISQTNSIDNGYDFVYDINMETIETGAGRGVRCADELKGGLTMNKLSVGTEVICNGYQGTVITVCDGVLAGMVEVRLARGVVCVSASAVKAL